MTDEAYLIGIHKAFLDFKLRAEGTGAEVLVQTFVDSAPLIDLMSSRNNQVVYGRRGTGKTHALKYVADLMERKGETSVYIDLRSIGSNTSIYNDSSRSLAARASYLIIDVLEALLANLYPFAVAALDTIPNTEAITIRLDDFQRSISGVKVVGTFENERTETNTASAKVSAGIGIGKEGPAAKAEVGTDGSVSNSERRKHSGEEILHIDFSSTQMALSGLLEVIGIKSMWLLIDEWSEVPVELQPYLADLFRRILLPTGRVITKIAAIEHRSNFAIRQDKGYIDLELGADISANLTLDDFLVFESDESRSIAFFKKMLFRHYQSSEHANTAVKSEDELIRIAFTQQNIFADFVRAVEGVPRDALNLCSTMATKAFGRKIAMTDINDAARDWYQRDKASAIKSDPKLTDALNIIINEVIGTRRSRAFLFSSKKRNRFIENLFDARLLHILKKNISSKDEPGERYDVFKIDYGCYVDLRNTNKSTLGLLQSDDDGYVQVPLDDYRSIRRNILTEAALANLAEDQEVETT